MERKTDLRVNIKGADFKNPVWMASGTFGCGEEFTDLIEVGELGAVVTKTVTLKKREGNPPPRVVETPSGLLNSIGLENKGVRDLCKSGIPGLKNIGCGVIASFTGSGAREIEECARILTDNGSSDALELNLSCPNVGHGDTRYDLMAQDPRGTESIVKAVKNITDIPLIVKLTPNVTSISEIAKAAEAGGADAVSLVNTYSGMAVDADSMTPVLGNLTGGLSGPAIKPMALKAVWDAYNNVRIPVIGIGGIMSGRDVAEFVLSGATCVQVGTANLTDPCSGTRILEEYREYLEGKNIKNTLELVGQLKTGETV